MLILNEGRTLVVGNESYCGTGVAPTFWQWLVLLAIITLVLPLMGMILIDPRSLTDPVIISTTLAISIGVVATIIVIRHTFTLLSSSDDLITATFDRETATMRIVFAGIFGLTQEDIPFADVHVFRSGRGEWDGAKVKEITIVELESGRSIILPGTLTGKELVVLKVLTGLRR